MLGLLTSPAGAPLGPATNDGVLLTARCGRVLDRKGAGSERICTEVGRRSVVLCCWEGCIEVCACARAGLVCKGVAVLDVMVEVGRTGSVTERVTTTLRGRRAGLLAGAREPRREPSGVPVACCGRTGKGREKGLGVAEMRREVVGAGRDAAALVRLPIMVDMGRAVGGAGRGACGGGEMVLTMREGGADELRSM